MLQFYFFNFFLEAKKRLLLQSRLMTSWRWVGQLERMFSFTLLVLLISGLKKPSLLIFSRCLYFFWFDRIFCSLWNILSFGAFLPDKWWKNNTVARTYKTLPPSFSQDYDKFTLMSLKLTTQMAQVVRRLLLVRKVWGSNPEPIKSPKHCQRLATVATLMCGPWRKAAEMGTAHSWHPKGY